MADTESGRPYLRPFIMALGVVAVVGIAVAISSLVDDESPVVTTTSTIRRSGTTAPVRIVAPSTVFSAGPPESIPRAAVAEAEWVRQDEWAGTLRSDHGHGMILAPGVVTGVYHEDGTVFAVDMETGEELWTTVVSDRRSAALFAIEDGGSVIAGGPGYVVSLDLASGEINWRARFEEDLIPIGAIPEQGHVLVILDRATDGVSTPPAVVMVHGKTGGFLWRTELDALDVAGVRVPPRAFVMAGKTLLVSVDVGTFALDANTGVVRWVADHGSPGSTVSNVPILVDAGVAYVPGPNGVVALDVATGAQLRSLDALSGAVPIAVDSDRLVVRDPGGVEGFDVASGESRWRFDRVEPTSAIVEDKTVYVSGVATVAAITADGGLKWERSLVTGRNPSLVPTAQDVVVVGENRVDSLDRKTGGISWTVPSGALQPPVARQGRIVISHGEGTLAMYRVPQATEWRTLPEPPLRPRSWASAVWTGSELLGWSGYSGTGPAGTAVVGVGFDLTTGEWRVLPEPPFVGGRHSFQTEIMDGEVALFGGTTEIVSEARTGALYELGDDGWTEMTPIEGIRLIDGVWTGRELLVVGWSGPVSKLMAYDPISGSWVERHAPPSDATAGSVTWADDRLIVWGESDTGFSYDPASDSWETLTGAPIAGRQGHTATWTGEEAVIFGGVDAAGNDRADGAAYNPETHEWHEISPGPLEARHDHHAVWSGSEILILGGTAGTSPIERSLKTAAAYNPATDSWRVLPDVPVTMATMDATWIPDRGLVLWGAKGAFLLPDGERDLRHAIGVE